jgi:V/A-type H+-transporting ATPase subunit D
MRALAGIALTRLNLLRAVRRLARIEKGVELLRRKREALVTEFFHAARPAADARAAIADRAQRAYPALLRALALHGYSGLRAMGWPPRDIAVDIRPAEIWGIPVSELTASPVLRRTVGARATAPGLTGPGAAEAADEFEAFAGLLLEAAPRELALRRLGEALALTSRQVNTLEQRLLPQVRNQIAFTRRALEEREREEHMRLRRLLRGRLHGRIDRLGEPDERILR